MFVSLGIDPGLASVGLSAVVRLDDGRYESRGVKVSRTEKNKTSAFSRMRSSADDQRRIREHWHVITQAIELLKPAVIGVENYLVFQPKDVTRLQETATGLVSEWAAIGQSRRALQEELGGDGIDRLLPHMTALADCVSRGVRDAIGLGQAAKTIAVYGATLGAAYTAGVPVFVFEPWDRTKRIAGKKGASKEEVGQAILARVSGLEAQMAEKVPQKTLREHAWDASCYAVLAAEEFVQQRLDLGVQPL